MFSWLKRLFERRYVYFVSLNYGNTERTGFGNVEILRNKPINDFDDIADIVNAIEKDFNLEDVVILSWSRMKRESK